MKDNERVKPKDEHQYYLTDDGMKMITVINRPIIQSGEYSYSPIEDIVLSSSVREIGEKAFYKCTKIGSVDLNKGLRVIGDYAFFLCENLADATLPQSLTKIGKYAFYNCYLSDVVVGGKVKVIEEEAFAENHMLTNIYINKGVEEIGRRAFFGCHNIENVELSSSIKDIKNGAFENTGLKEVKLPKLTKIEQDVFRKSKIKKIYIPDSVVEIGSGAFSETPLVNIDMQYGLKKIGDGAFAGCEQLEEIDIPNSVENISKGAFSKCKNLFYIKLPLSLKEISPNLFENCTKLGSIVIPYGVRRIGEGAFKHTDLREVELPEHVTEIAKEAFANSEYLQRIRLSENVKEIGDSAFEGCESLHGIALPKGLVKLGSNAFKNCLEIKYITVPKGIEKLANNTFSFCESLEEVILPNTLKSIGEGAFCNCAKLEEIAIPDSVNFIEKAAFSSCDGLKKITIPDSVKFIGDEVFNSCKNLQKVVLPKGIVSIASEVFSDCSKLKTIEFPDSLSMIGFYAFKNTGLEVVELGDNITFLDAGVFNNCCQLSQIRLPKNIKTINEETFSGCLSLTDIDLPDGITIINDQAFMNCMSLVDLVLPKDLKFIGKMTFKGCEQLKEIKLPDGVEFIGEEAFMGCSSLEKLEVPKGVRIIGNDAFNSCSSLKELIINGGNLQECLFNIGQSIEVVKISKDCKCNAKMFYPFEYLTKQGEYFCLTRQPINENSESILDINEKLSLGVLMESWDNREQLFRELRNPNAENIIKLYNYLYRELDAKQFAEFFKTKQLKQFNKLCLANPKFNDEYLYKLFYNLGGFLKPFVETRVNSSQVESKKMMDYGQIVSELFKDIILPNEFIRENISYVCNGMKLDGFKSDFSRFISDRKILKEMIEEELKAFGFIKNCYNHFEEVQKTNTSNKGRQRVLYPTIQKFRDYFREVKYAGITEENRHIADVLAPYYSSQSVFDNATVIDKERRESGVPNRILKVHLKENNMLNSIEKYSDKIKKLYADSLKNLISVAESSFSFDWLEKNDPYNFLLGKITSSCAHLEGVGFGIMKASIVHPDVQNLVIRNKKGEIVAKSTLYVNREQGYGLLNTVEIENVFSDQEKLAIYRKFKLAVGAFAERYNKENPDKPIKIINVGIHLNRLEDQIKANDKEATKVLTQINYQDYGNSHDNYNGDSTSGQYTVWELDDSEQDL